MLKLPKQHCIIIIIIVVVVIVIIIIILFPRYHHVVTVFKSMKFVWTRTDKSGWACIPKRK